MGRQIQLAANSISHSSLCLQLTSKSSGLRRLFHSGSACLQPHSAEDTTGSTPALNDSPAPVPLKFDPYCYTSGRWLRHNKPERDARYIKFDFGALCQKVLALGRDAASIADCQKIEGGFNRAFIFTLDNGERIVARLPFSIAGPAQLTTASEVATIRYLQPKTSIPIPKILDWSQDAQSADNAIGSEYIIMDHAAGVPLNRRWSELSGDQRVICIDAICRKIKEMVNLDFPAYGSLYHAENRAPSRSQRALDNEFCIGPHCGIRYWDCTGGEGRYYDDLEPNRGPWNDIHQYSDGLIDAGLSRLPPSISDGENRPSYHGSVESHKILLEQARIWLKTISTDHRINASSRPVLYHPDLHTRNIFVSEKDPSVITGIIDWQAASIEPAFWYSDEIPDFATSDEPGDEVYTQAFNMASQFLTPVHFNPRLMDENLFRPFRYSYRTWKDGAVALRHELIETTRNWEKLGFSGQCPLPPPTTEELANHEQEYKLFEAAQNLRRDLSSLLNTATDGWMPPESWETTKLAHKEIFDGMLQAVLANEEVDDDPVKDEATLRSIWPFDID